MALHPETGVESAAHAAQKPSLVRKWAQAVTLTVAGIIASGVDQAEARGFGKRSSTNRATVHQPLSVPAQAPESSANRYIRQFPEKITGIAKVEKRIEPDAKHALFIWRQTHWVPDLPEEYQGEVLRCQTETRAAMLEVDVQVARPEGYVVDPQNLRPVQPGHTGSQEPPSLLLHQPVFCLSTIDPQLQIESMAKPDLDAMIQRKRGHIAQLIHDGAIHVLASEQKVQIQPSEYALLNERVGDMYDHPERYTKQEFDAAMENREDALFELSSRFGAPIIHAQYGAAHRWIDNQERHNRHHPEAKYSVVEITPKTLVGMKMHWYPNGIRENPPPPPPPGFSQ